MHLLLQLYDYLLTVEQEVFYCLQSYHDFLQTNAVLQVNLVWKSNWGIGKVIYLFARYSALIDVPWTVWRTLHELPLVLLSGL
jgi:hypothetical protein